MNTKSYSELILLPTLKDRILYLQTKSLVGDETFGSRRYLNQKFYTSAEWKDFRNSIIIRDNGMDLALDGYPINGRIILHHLNPISIDDVTYFSRALVDPENVVCVSDYIHRMIHYGNSNLEIETLEPVIRQPNDTKLW